jgi:DeoR/GlpR family transcriptional regulator of sugar metabolism
VSNVSKKKLSREDLLMSLLNLEGHISTDDAVRLTGVSQATVRRMFLELEKNGKIIRTYGGVQLPGSLDSYRFEQREKVSEDEKRRIGVLAASLVEDRDTVYLDCGTTVLQMAIALGERLRLGGLSGLNIVTNSIANLHALGETSVGKIILLGGEYHSARRDFFGPITERYAEPFHFNKCFLGCEGVTVETGFSSNKTGLSSLNANIVGRSDRRYVLFDASKAGKGAFFSYAPLERIDEAITDSQPEEPLYSRFNAAGTVLHIATGQQE